MIQSTAGAGGSWLSLVSEIATQLGQLLPRDRLKRVIGRPSPHAGWRHHAAGKLCRHRRVQASSRCRLSWCAHIWRTPNNASGIAALVRRVRRLGSPHVVCEATGGSTRRLMSDLAVEAIALSRVNPRHVRDFTRATGRRAKTDDIDAAAILRFADAMQPLASPAPSPEQVRLIDLVRRRR
ncbi:MAG: hypothetical protein EON55_01450 [Alphaproteobacteria bacterium]|nr:MAG: hypothetical protein EON55_01450 [Alphaproteobacteria bacterium]